MGRLQGNAEVREMTPDEFAVLLKVLKSIDASLSFIGLVGILMLLFK